MSITETPGWCDVVAYTSECPRCGAESDVHIGKDADATEKPRFCPACGEPIDGMAIETVCAADIESTSKERREVAERLRGEAEGFCRLCEEHDYAWTVDLGDVPAIFQDITHYAGLDGVVRADAIFDRLADLIDLPTCRNVSGYQDVFECSECRCKVELITEVSNEYGEPFSVSFTPSFCPGCGALVMDNE